MHLSRRSVLTLMPLLVMMLFPSTPAVAASGGASVDASAACAAYAAVNAKGRDWVCFGSGLTSTRRASGQGPKTSFTDTRSGESVDLSGLTQQAAERAVQRVHSEATARPIAEAEVYGLSPQVQAAECSAPRQPPTSIMHRTLPASLGPSMGAQERRHLLTSSVAQSQCQCRHEIL